MPFAAAIVISLRPRARYLGQVPTRASSIKGPVTLRDDTAPREASAGANEELLCSRATSEVSARGEREEGEVSLGRRFVRE